MNIGRLLLVVPLLVLLGACSSTWSTAEMERPGGQQGAVSEPATAEAEVPADSGSGQEAALPPSDPARIQITEGDISNRPYSVIGDISVTVNKTTLFHPDPTKELVAEKLREKAGEIGADAVVLVRYGTVGVSFFSWGSLDGKGRAVKFK